MTTTNATDIDDALLGRLRTELGLPVLSFGERPARLTGGYDTLTIRFSLEDGPPGMGGPLVARIFRDDHGAERARRETRIHTAVAEQGYPAPTVLHCSDSEQRPGAFILMPLVPGMTLRQAMSNPIMLWQTPGILARWHARLHALGASRIGHDERSAAMADWPRMLSHQAEAAGVSGFDDALEWASRNAPAATREAILHLDFHPGNIMVQGGTVTGVLDWANGTTGDPASDVGTAVALFTMGPVDAPRLATPVLDGIRGWLARRYLAEYRRINPVPLESVRYYEARRCLTAMLHVAIRRAGSTLGDRDQYAWDGAQQITKMTRRFEQLSGIHLPIEP